jgi:hypothetical protein
VTSQVLSGAVVVRFAAQSLAPATEASGTQRGLPDSLPQSASVLHPVMALHSPPLSVRVTPRRSTPLASATQT